MSLSLSNGSPFDLLCGEDAGILAGSSPERPPAAEFPADSAESIAGFVGAESDYTPGSDYPARLRSRSLDPLAREESVSWILKVHAYYRFQPLTAYLAVNYMDRFLSSHCLPQVNGWPLQLLVVACLSLAAKMEETLVPSLLDLQVEGARFIFEPRTICKMELMVLAALNWRLRSVTPFTFIDFFVHKADPSGPYARFLISRATEIILAALYGVVLEHCPSVMAAAAIICAADEIPFRAFINPTSAEKWCSGLTEEGISNCYRLMRGDPINDNTGQKPLKIIPQLRVTTLDNMTPSGPASSYFSPPNKRRKMNNQCLLVDGDKE